jgi:hypothetical protein
MTKIRYYPIHLYSKETGKKVPIAKSPLLLSIRRLFCLTILFLILLTFPCQLEIIFVLINVLPAVFLVVLLML